MISSLDKYFQICRCFRDEDLRADRQPEFSQIDIEVSFLTQDYIKNLACEIVKNLFNLSQFDLPVLSYAEVMDRFGSDKPDLRYGLEQRNVTSFFAESSFSLFKEIASKNGLIKVMFFPTSSGNLSRADLDGLKDVVSPYGGKGVAYLKKSEGAYSGPMQKYIPTELAEKFHQLLEIENKADGYFLFFADNNHDAAHNCADAVRRHLAHKFKIFNENEYKFLWVNDFPLFDYDETENRFYAKHHPFTMPKAEFVDDFMSGDAKRIRPILADAYDIVCNGYEIGGGSLRIYDSNIQAQMFRVLGLSEEDAKRQFGFFIEALQYGTPPHGGMAFGLDRLVMLKARTDNIRDVMAFPKTASATDLMSQAPSIANPDQLKELKMKFID
jgi:aspartyl-tRNA synthetase